jgi:oxepin-CoA hydrolase/3-oxo-5,6-dehydrosuberyl-CoA semialdehyde dehydrogenase
VETIASYVSGEWTCGTGEGRTAYDAATGEPIGKVSSDGIDIASMLEYGRKQGSPELRAMTMHERGRMIKALALYLNGKKKSLYELSARTGATRADSWIDIDGGIGTLFVYASKGRREAPDEPFFYEGPVEPLSKNGTFIGTHISVPLLGVAVHINAFNFPCWGMLEKLAPTWLAGMPAIVKPASDTCYLTQALVKEIIDSQILPPGSLQLICGGVHDLLDQLNCQDVVTFTGSAATGQKLRSNPNLLGNTVRFNMEADSLNCSILADDVKPEDEEFGLFIKEVAKEMTVKAGQKCTAIRRIIIPALQEEAVLTALKERLEGVSVGDPALKEVRMGPLASAAQVKDVAGRVEELQQVAEVVYQGRVGTVEEGRDLTNGAFFPVTLLRARDVSAESLVHSVEAFGPVSTVVPYSDRGEAIRLANLGGGSLVASIFSADDFVARQIALGIAPYHGRLVLLNRHSAGESTGHGSPLPHMVHGGPGRAGGGEEMGGMRGLHFYCQRVALQGHPSTLGAVCNQWFRGGRAQEPQKHLFQHYFEELRIGDRLISEKRKITQEDVEKFADLSGDHFYAHMDDEQAQTSIFDARVAHGYFLVSAAAGLFVDPDLGPVLANYGLENLRFFEPVYFDDEVYVKFTCKRKTRREKKEDQPLAGIVEWDVEIINQKDEPVASYSILTLVKCQDQTAEI